jgi:hypothetical protein
MQTLTFSHFTIGFSGMPNMKTYPQKARDRIAGSKIVSRLIAHVHGEIQLSHSQVAAARILLAKVLPDMKSLDIKASVKIGKPTYQLTDDELLAIASGKIVRLHPPAPERPVIESTAVKKVSETVPAARVVNGTLELPDVKPAPLDLDDPGF